MVKAWILYGMTLVGTVLFHAYYFGWYSWFLLLLVLLIPWFSLALSLHSMAAIRIEMEAPPSCSRGETAYLTLRARGGRLPLPKCQFKLNITGMMTGKTKTIRQLVPGREIWYEPLEPEHCGTLRCSMEKGRVYDYLGLFCLPVHRCEPVETMVLPTAMQPVHLPNLSKFKVRLRKPKPGGGFSEEHELREYRPGDSMRDIHWKLSAKTDRLIVREAMEPIRERTILSLDLCDDPDRLDSVLSQLLWLSDWLLEHDTVHQICWLEPATRQLQTAEIAREEDLSELLRRLLHTALQANTPTIANRRFADAAWRYHIEPEQEVAP